MYSGNWTAAHWSGGVREEGKQLSPRIIKCGERGGERACQIQYR